VKDLKQLTKAPSFLGAIKAIWRAGVEAFEQEAAVADLQKTKARLQEESLALSRLVHDYETKIHNIVRENEELRKQNREFEWAYRALRRENQWLKEEVFKLKGRPLQ
jgi:chromosome segregation ATPase